MEEEQKQEQKVEVEQEEEEEHVLHLLANRGSSSQRS